jgi:hypothetical protein
MRVTPLLVALVLTAALVAPAVFFAPEAEASFCNVCPPWGFGVGFLDLCSCVDIISCFSGISILSCFNFGNICNFLGVIANCFSMFNFLGVIANCFSMFNYSVECGWNFCGYCLPCTIFSCFNLVNLWSGRVTCFNVLEVMSGLCSFGNLIDIASGSCINLMSCVKCASGLYPPFIASGGCLNLLTGCNPCNLCLPLCFSTGVTDCLNYVCGLFVAPIQCASMILNLCAAICLAPILILLAPILLLLMPLYGLSCTATGTVPCAACLGPLYEAVSRTRSYLSSAYSTSQT